MFLVELSADINSYSCYMYKTGDVSVQYFLEKKNDCRCIFSEMLEWHTLKKDWTGKLARNRSEVCVHRTVDRSLHEAGVYCKEMNLQACLIGKLESQNSELKCPSKKALSV